MDCFQDFCLFCDRDSPDGPYCSQRCKLADLEKASTSQSGSPTSSSSPRDTRYVLSPAYKFHHDQHSHTPGYDAPAVTSSRRPRSSYFMWTASPSTRQPDRPSLDDRSLSPSSSRTSLSSTSSGSSSTAASGAFSAQAKQQLQDYFSSFDQARAAKRRSSTRST
jgi:endogenous inhibitor of DNA gyrase (YacG/DUF329 family)